MANYNVDIQVGIKGTSALDKFTKTVNALAEKTELVNKNFSKGIQNIARYEQNLNRTARTLKLARTGQQQETRAIKNFVKALGEANTARERQEHLIKKEIATQNAAKRVTSPGPTGFSSAQFGPALPPAMVKRLQFFKDRAVAERKFIELTEAGNRAARQRTAELLKQQRILKAGGNQFPGGVGPQQAPLQGPRQAPGFQGVAAKRVEAQVRRNAQASIEAAKKVSQIELALDRKLEMAGLKREMNIFRNKEKLAEKSFKNEKRRNKEQVADFDKRLRQATAARSAAGKQKSKSRSDLALGIGFPLLFGGGAGSIAGGALGALGGGGMGGQVLGSAIGGQLDQFAQRTTSLAQALRGAGDATQELEGFIGVLNSETSRRIRNLQESGQTARAADAAFKELSKTIGVDNAKALVQAGRDFETLGDKTTQFFTILGASIAGLFQEAFYLNLRDPLSNVPEASPELLNARRQSSQDLQSSRLQTAAVRARGTDSFEDDAAADKALVRQEELNNLAEFERQVKGGQKDAEKDINEKLKIQEDARRAILQIDQNLLRSVEQRSKENERLAETKRRKAEAAAKNAAREAEAALRRKAKEVEQEKRERQQLATGLLGEYISQVEIIAQRRQLGKTELVQLAEQRSRLELIFQARVKILKIANHETSLASAKLKTLKQRRDFEIEQIKFMEKQIELQNRLDPANGDPAVKGVRAGFKAGREADEKLTKQAEELDALYKGIGNTIQTGIVDAIETGIEGLINGTKDLGESLQEIASGVLKDIGRQLLSFGVKVGLQSLGTSLFAEGGYVTGPTSAVIGEGGEPEYIIPESKMRESMSRYSSGSRGSAVIPAQGGGAGGSGGGATGTAPIDVRYTVERINEVDYVTADQFQRGMVRAAEQGAARGEQQTLRKLRMSNSTRRRVGV